MNKRVLSFSMLAFLAAGILGACGTSAKEEGVKYEPETFKAKTWEELNKEDWANKEIAYQFLPGSVDSGDFWLSTYAIMTNLYADGSLACYQIHKYSHNLSVMSSRTFDDPDHNVYYAYYGYWEKSTSDAGVTTITTYKWARDLTAGDKESLITGSDAAENEIYAKTVFDDSAETGNFSRVETTDGKNRFYVLSADTSWTNTNAEYVHVVSDSVVYYNNICAFYGAVVTGLITEM